MKNPKIIIPTVIVTLIIGWLCLDKFMEESVRRSKERVPSMHAYTTISFWLIENPKKHPPKYPEMLKLLKEDFKIDDCEFLYDQNETCENILKTKTKLLRHNNFILYSDGTIEDEN